MKFGIIKERKNPPDKRVVLSPQACVDLQSKYDLKFVVEPSNIRTFSDETYAEKGLCVDEDLSECDVLLGVKEVPINALIPNKKYFFFSHTIKKQPYNRALLRAILEKNIELYDHEVITNTKNQRVVAFGRYAGIVGAYNTIRTYGLKYGSFEIAKAEELLDQAHLIAQLNSISLPPVKIVLTGKGRVAGGAKEMLDAMAIKQVEVESFLNENFNEPVYCQLDVLDYNIRIDGQKATKQQFFTQPELFESDFARFSNIADVFIAGHFFGDGSPYLFTRDDAKSEGFNIKVVGDISCDIDGPVASTIRPSTIANPVYGYDAQTEQEVDFKLNHAIAVMAVDNLPCELPKDASIGFGESFATHVIPAFFNNDADGVLERARMTQNGKLTPRFAYLQNYVDGLE